MVEKRSKITSRSKSKSGGGERLFHCGYGHFAGPAGTFGGGNGGVGDDFLAHILWRHGGRDGFGGFRGEFLGEFGQETLGGPGAGLAKGTNGLPSDVVRHIFQDGRIAVHAAASHDAVVGARCPAKRGMPLRPQ